MATASQSQFDFRLTVAYLHLQQQQQEGATATTRGGNSNNNCESNCCCDYFHCKLLWNFTYNSLAQNMEIAHATPPCRLRLPPLALPWLAMVPLAACHLPLAAKPPATAAVTCRINLSTFSHYQVLPPPLSHHPLLTLARLVPQPKLNSLVWPGPGCTLPELPQNFAYINIYEFIKSEPHGAASASVSPA